MKQPIDPEKDFAGFVEERLREASRLSKEGHVHAMTLWHGALLESAGPADLDAIEDLARYFSRAASEIRAISKAIRRKHGVQS